MKKFNKNNKPSENLNNVDFSEKAPSYNKVETLDDLERAERVTHAMNRVAFQLERSRIGDYVTMMGKPIAFLRLNFLAGMARGLGFGIGFTLLGALFLYILQAIGDWVPFIGQFVADVMVYANQLSQLR